VQQLRSTVHVHNKERFAHSDHQKTSTVPTLTKTTRITRTTRITKRSVHVGHITLPRHHTAPRLHQRITPCGYDRPHKSQITTKQIAVLIAGTLTSDFLPSHRTHTTNTTPDADHGPDTAAIPRHPLFQPIAAACQSSRHSHNTRAASDHA
jgi:hypothetical protein